MLGQLKTFTSPFSFFLKQTSMDFCKQRNNVSAHAVFVSQTTRGLNLEKIGKWPSPCMWALSWKKDVAGDFGSVPSACRAPLHINSGHSELFKACEIWAGVRTPVCLPSKCYGLIPLSVCWDNIPETILTVLSSLKESLKTLQLLCRCQRFLEKPH